MGFAHWKTFEGNYTDKDHLEGEKHTDLKEILHDIEVFITKVGNA